MSEETRAPAPSPEKEATSEQVEREIDEALATGDAVRIAEIFEDEPILSGRAIFELDEDETRRVVALVEDEDLADVLAELDAADAAEVLGRLPPAEAADIVEEMDPDDAADVVEEMDSEEAEGVLTRMEEPEAAEVRGLLLYPPETAGGRMTTEFAHVAASLTVEQAIAYIRAFAAEAETIYYVYVTGPDQRLLGVLSLRSLVLARPDEPIANIMAEDVVRVRVDADQEQVARVLQERNLLAVPVVDDQERLLGIVTADDVGDVLVEEATEDITRLGGSQPLGEPYMRASILELARKRVPWLLLLFVGQAYTGSVLSHFQEEIASAVALAFFIPMLIGTGGNVGSQTVTLVIRAMAVGEVKFHDLARVVGKELLVGAVMAAILGGATFLRAMLLGVDVGVGYTVALAAVFIVIWAAVVAAALPILLRQLRVDPSVVSTPLISTLVDGTGLFIYLTVAHAILDL